MQNNTRSTKPRRRILTGVVTGDRMDKTIVIRVTSMAKHRKYKKIIKRYSSFKAHDEENKAKAGDTVRIIESRPISKDKRWRLVEIIK